MDQLIRLKTDADSARENLRKLEGQAPESFIVFDGEEVTLAITMPKMQYTERLEMTMETVLFKNDEEENGAEALIAA